MGKLRNDISTKSEENLKSSQETVPTEIMSQQSAETMDLEQNIEDVKHILRIYIEAIGKIFNLKMDGTDKPYQVRMLRHITGKLNFIQEEILDMIYRTLGEHGDLPEYIRNISFNSEISSD